MPEQYQVLNTGFEFEGGEVEIPPDVLADITIITDNIVDINLVADFLRGETPTPEPLDIDGNNTTIQIRRDTTAGWAATNPILAQGEFGFVTDVAPYAFKVGDGVTTFDLLPNSFDGADFVYDDLLTAVAAAEAAQAASETAEAGSVTASDSAVAAASEAVDSAQLSENWATAPESLPLPGGHFSAEVNAGKASQAAAVSRKVELRAAITASETMPITAIYKRTLANPSGAMIVTIPPNLFQDVGNFEAWATYRLGVAGGSCQFVPQGGSSDLVTPISVVLAHARLRIIVPVVTAKTLTGTITLAETLTDGALLIELLFSNNVAATVTIDLTCTLSNSLTATPIQVPTHTSAVNVFDAAVWEADLGTTFAPTTVTYNISVNSFLNVMGVAVRFVKNPGGAPVVTIGRTNANASSVTATITALAAQSAVFAFAAMAGTVSAGYSFTGFSANVAESAKGDSASDPEGPTGNAARNMVWGTGYGTPNVTGDFAVTATFGSAHPLCLCLVSYPPKSSPGAGTVNLFKANGDTLTVAHSEAELFFAPNGTDVYMRILP